MVFEIITLLLFLKVICCESATLALEMMKQHCYPANCSCIRLKSANLFGVEGTCHSKRHSVLCASELLIIYGFIICVV